MTAPVMPHWGRRRWLASMSALAVTACGGGGGTGEPTGGGGQESPGNPPPPPPPPPPPGPRITAFQASASHAWMGDTVRLRGEFSGGTGRIEPFIGEIASATEVPSMPLDRSARFRLVVSSPGFQDAEQTLDIQVDYRDRYDSPPVQLVASDHAAVMADDGGVLLLGGSRLGGVPATAIERYDPRSRSLQTTGTLVVPRPWPVAVRLANNTALLTGGAFDVDGATLAELVDLRTGRSVTAGRTGVARIEHAAAPLPGGRVLVTGGFVVGEGGAMPISHSAEIWDPLTSTFRRLAAHMAIPRAGHTMSVLRNGQILIVGGESDRVEGVFAERFDPVSEQFIPVPGPLRLRRGHAALVSPDGGVLIAGGDEIDASGRVEPTDSVWRYDPAMDVFQACPALANARSQVAAAMLPDGRALVFGGRGAAQVSLAQAEVYDALQGSTTVRRMTSERQGHTVTRLLDGRILLVGGSDGNEDMSGFEIYE